IASTCNHLVAKQLDRIGKTRLNGFVNENSAASTARKEIRTFRMLLVLLLMVLQSLTSSHWSNESQRLYSFLLLLAYTNHGINFLYLPNKCPADCVREFESCC
uniref:G_PROTEIN_RECEP_F1_2 domain-containing protein n=1 Tax=Macrostomum lignano TaxID=282301 RepID=A0A1I8FML6_9PLAT